MTSSAARTRIRFAALVAAPAGAALAASVPAAQATHLQGGFFTADVTADARLKGTLTYLEMRKCAAGVGTQ